MDQKGLLVVSTERKRSGLLYAAIVGVVPLVALLVYLFVSPDPTEPLPAAYAEPVVNAIQETTPTVVAEKVVEAEPPKPQFPPPPPPIEPKHAHYHIKVKDVTAAHVPEIAAKRVTIACSFDDTSKNEKILSLLVYSDIHRFRTDAGYPIEMKPVLLEMGYALRPKHSGDFRVELLVPEKARTLEYLDASIGVVWEKSRATLRFEDPANARGATLSHGGFKFRLQDLSREGSTVKAQVSVTAPGISAGEPPSWPYRLIRARLYMPQGPALEARASSMAKESVYMFRYQGSLSAKTLELDFVDKIEMEQYPFRLTNVSLPTLDEMHQQIGSKPELKFDSGDLLFTLRSLKSQNTQRGNEIQTIVNVEWAPEKKIIACGLDFHDVQARDNTGLELKWLNEPNKNISNMPYINKTSQFKLSVPAPAAETLSYLRGKFEIFAVSEFDELNISAPSSEEISKVEQRQGNAKIVSIERTHNKLIVQSDLEMPKGVDPKWHGWLVKTSIVDEKGNSKIPNATVNKSVHGKTPRFLRTDTYEIDHFQPHRIKLSLVKNGAQEIVPFEFKDVPLRDRAREKGHTNKL